MGRIIYFAFSDGGVAGGHKMIFRHVETLRDLGFDAFAYVGAQNVVPAWFEHRAPVLVGVPVSPDDVLVAPGDAAKSLAQAARLDQRTVIFSQGHTPSASEAVSAIDLFPPDRLPPFMAVGPMLATVTRRLFPQAEVEVVPCFADERRFRPAADRRRAVAVTPHKRPQELGLIRDLFRRFHPDQADLPWLELVGRPEAEVADAFGTSTLHLALARMESVGITTLEAMAGGCVCAGFRGVGGREYATADNGFWVDDEDCVAAADALQRADDLARTGGPALARMLEASRQTAARWSYAVFRDALEVFWMRHAPDLRRRAGPLDA